MKTVDKVLVQVESQQRQNRPYKTQKIYSPTPMTLKLVAALFARMASLYRNKWTSTEGAIKGGDGMPSDNYLLWCEKLDGLTGEQIKHGLEALESRLEASALEGKELWPPCYAEFKGLCKPKLSPAPGANVDAYKVIGNHGIPDITGRERQAKRNHSWAAKMREELKKKGQINM